MADIEEAEKIIKEAENGGWEGVIKLQINPNRDNYHAEILKYVLHALDKEKILSADLIKNEAVYLVALIRYFGMKPLNSGYHFRKEKDAKSFVKQYKEIIASFYSEERELVEKDEKIKIIEMKLISEESIK